MTTPSRTEAARLLDEADASLLDLVGVSVPAVARALLFRMATTSERDDLPDVRDEARRYTVAAAAIGL